MNDKEDRMKKMLLLTLYAASNVSFQEFGEDLI